MTENKKRLSIKGWAKEDRPREKFLQKGKGAVTDAELLAIVIRSGTKDQSAVSLSKSILGTVENKLNKLAKLSIHELQEFKGIGQAKALAISTALELGKRRSCETQTSFSRIESSKNVFEYMRPIVGELEHEEFWAIFLNNANKIIHKEQLSKGGLTGTIVDVRLLMKKAIALKTTGLIICHNHPSGTLKPSVADKKITDKIVKAGEILDIKLLDHIIISENAYFSFADEGILY